MFSLGNFLYILEEETELVVMNNLSYVKGYHHAYQILQIPSVRVKNKNIIIQYLENRIKKRKNYLAFGKSNKKKRKIKLFGIWKIKQVY